MRLMKAGWCDAIALVESGNEGSCLCHEAAGSVECTPLGDAGAAIGRYQLHPAFAGQWLPPLWFHLPTWDEVWKAAIGRFWEQANIRGSSDVEAAVGFHLHGQPWATGVDMASAEGAAYAARFNAAVERLIPG